MYIPSSRWTWTFLLIAVVQACVVLAFESYIFAQFQIDLRNVPTDRNNPDTELQTIPKAVPTFLALYIFGFFYDLVLVYDALRMKNTIQVIGLVLMNVGLFIYGVIQLDTVADAVNELSHKTPPAIEPELWPTLRPFMIAIPCVLGVTTVAMGFVARKLYHEFAWSIYKVISADLRMRKRYLNYQIFIALLKFDFFFFLGFTIQFVVIVRGRTDAEFGLTIAAIPVTIFILFMAAFFIRREILTGMIAIILLFFAGMAYFVFKLVRMYQPGLQAPYLPARKELTTFAVLTILLIVVTIIYACICCYAFGTGLKPFINKRTSGKDVEKSTTTSGSPSRYSDAGYGHAQGVELNYPYGQPAPGRMEID